MEHIIQKRTCQPSRETIPEWRRGCGNEVTSLCEEKVSLMGIGKDISFLKCCFLLGQPDITIQGRCTNKHSLITQIGVNSLNKE